MPLPPTPPFSLPQSPHVPSLCRDRRTFCGVSRRQSASLSGFLFMLTLLGNREAERGSGRPWPLSVQVPLHKIAWLLRIVDTKIWSFILSLSGFANAVPSRSTSIFSVWSPHKLPCVFSLLSAKFLQAAFPDTPMADAGGGPLKPVRAQSLTDLASQRHLLRVRSSANYLHVTSPGLRTHLLTYKHL